MSQYQKILLIVDPSLQETPALRRAERIARATGAELHLCLFEHLGALLALGLISGEVMDAAKWSFVTHREKWLRAQTQKLRDRGLSVESEFVWGKPVHEKIIDKVVALQPDLVIKDIHLEPQLKRVLFTPLDWQLLRLCPAQLLLVNGAAHEIPRRVIAAVDTGRPADGTEKLNDRIVHAALELAIQCDAQLHLVHAFQEILPVLPADVVIPQTFDDAYMRLRGLHAERFERFADRHSVPREFRHFIYGSPSYTLADFAQDAHTDVLVLGTVYRTGLDRIIIGSTAERILGDLRCDVLAVKPEGFMADLARHFGFDKLQREVEQRLAEPIQIELCS